MGLNRKSSRTKFFIAPKLMLTSMMDMFTIVLIFLLFSFSDSPEAIKIDKDLELPRSSAEMDYGKNLKLVLTKSSLILDNEIIANLDNGKVTGLDQKNPKSSILYKRLRTIFEKKQQNGKNSSEENQNGREIIFLCDKSHEFKTINQVIKTAGLAGYPNFQFAVLQD